jgi:hypothetical protein
MMLEMALILTCPINCLKSAAFLTHPHPHLNWQWKYQKVHIPKASLKTILLRENIALKCAFKA